MKLSANILAATLFSVVAACSSSNDDTQAAPALGKRGETCQSHADCQPDLVCDQGACRIPTYPLQPTGMQCFTIECTKAEDCCPPRPSSCDSWAQNCEAGLTYDCTSYQTLCVCDGSKFLCEQETCVATCSQDDAGIASTCPSGYPPVCSAGKCVECAQDTDCTLVYPVTPRVCRQNKCQTKCTIDDDCDYFQKCQDSICVKSGCTADRECIADRNDPLAVCRDGTCQIPCQTDFECPPSTTATPTLQVCQAGSCVSVGCQGDAECRIWLHIQPGSTQQAVCRQPTQP